MKITGLDLILIMAVIVYITFAFGTYRPMIVLSSSMEPTFTKGSIIIGERVRSDTDLKIGDICTYISEDGYTITHRIVKKDQDGFIFKGDNNDKEDEKPVKREHIKYVIAGQ